MRDTNSDKPRSLATCMAVSMRDGSKTVTLSSKDPSNKAVRCGKYATRLAISSKLNSRRFLPSKSTSPCDGSMMPAINCSKALRPEPLLPPIATHSPALMSRERFSKIGVFTAGNWKVTWLSVRLEDLSSPGTGLVANSATSFSLTGKPGLAKARLSLSRRI